MSKNRVSRFRPGQLVWVFWDWTGYLQQSYEGEGMLLQLRISNLFLSLLNFYKQIKNLDTNMDNDICILVSSEKLN